MIDFYTLFFILILHFIGDFKLQTDEQAKKKSTSNRFLFYHVITYSLLFFIFMWILSRSFKFALLYFVITFITHFITDYITSRSVKKYYEKNDTHTMFFIIGLDQLIHYTTLILGWFITLKIYRFL